MSRAPDCVVFDSTELLPDVWRKAAGTSPVWAFNPGLVRDGDGWLLAYRIVLADQLRRIAICRLDRDLRVMPGSPSGLSDQLRLPPGDRYPDVVHRWFADPRLYRWGDRLFVYWNSGWHEPCNHQFLQELDARTLTPFGQPRELVLCGERRPLEKNWTFFTTADGDLLCVYSIMPHRVLRASFDVAGEVRCAPLAETAFAAAGYPASHGGLRGGAPPVWHDGHYWSFAHSIHDGATGYRYEAAAYAFAAAVPFAPRAEPVMSLDLAGPHRDVRHLPSLNPAVESVVYPCGAAIDGGTWLISYGLNDERCGIARIPHETVAATVRAKPQS